MITFQVNINRVKLERNIILYQEYAEISIFIIINFYLKNYYIKLFAKYEFT